MKSFACVLALIVGGVAQSAFALEAFCIYSDNKVTPEKPNGSILTTTASIADGTSSQIVSLAESSGLVRAELSVSGDTKTLSVVDSNGKRIYNKSTDLESGSNFLASLRDDEGRKSVVSVVCITRHK